MFRKSIFWSILTTIVLVGLLVVGGFAIYRAGYAAGAMADLSEVSANVPARLYQFPMPFSGFRVMGLIFGILIFAMIVKTITHLFMFRRWKAADCPMPGLGMAYHPHRWYPHHPGYAWPKDYNQPEGESAAHGRESSQEN
ncbi:MAG: hypothetical protein U9Q82_10985 [Chloroflexota bacterium]|nr:hypothetical protein [Chloroflexota bacterium]